MFDSAIDSALTFDEDFLSPYQKNQPNWGFGGLGFIVYLRTYSRRKDDGTLERWWETCRRVTEGNFRIEARRLNSRSKLTPAKLNALVLEMRQFFHCMYNLLGTPPGRGLWMSGTKYAEKVGDAENNCWLVVMKPQPFTTGEKPSVAFAPCFTFDMAMKGGGVGVNVQRQNVSQIPMVKNPVLLDLMCRADHPNAKELQDLGVTLYTDADMLPNRWFVPDSRQGWMDTLRVTIEAHYDTQFDLGAKVIVPFDLSDIRPRGAEIKGFGGIASGPGPLVDMLQKVNVIINAAAPSMSGDYLMSNPREVTPTEWGDVIQNIGCCVVAGNVRRTALILIGDESDKQFVESKNYSLAGNAVPSQWRWASNNSVDITTSSSRETLQQLAENIYYNGEPGYVNIGLAQNYGRIVDGYQEGIDAEVEGFNPCGEITLPNASPCNLFEINLDGIEALIQKGIETDELYWLVARLAARYTYRITFRPYEWEATRNVVERHRRLGVGITGITDWALRRFGKPAVLHVLPDGTAVYNKEVCEFLDHMFKVICKANVEQAQDLEAEPSIKKTTVKPSGTMSLLMGVSPGQHNHWAGYAIRRVTVSAESPLCQALVDAGYPFEPKQKGTDNAGNPVYDYRSLVFEFPIKAPTADHEHFQSAGDVSLEAQAALQALLATHWSDNAVSATLSFHKAKPKPVYFEDGSVLLDKFGLPQLQIDPKDERRVVGQITDILDRYKSVIKSTSLLPYASGTYPQMPYEEINKAEYDRRVALIKLKPWELLTGDIQAEDEDTTDTSSECVGGACPVK